MTLQVASNPVASPLEARMVPMDASESQLLDGARGGSLDAFEELYRRHVGRVYAVCVRMAGDRATAEELTQDTFVRAWQHLGTFRGDAALSTWLHRVAVNIVLAHHRARSRRPEGHADVEEAALEHHAPALVRPDIAVDLERAIASLPPRAREVFVLHDVEGHTHDEVSDLTGMAVGTSKAHLHRARRLLREALKS
jgi:RNA polymerase sigma-70 factor (ECF subfamily)